MSQAVHGVVVQYAVACPLRFQSVLSRVVCRSRYRTLFVSGFVCRVQVSLKRSLYVAAVSTSKLVKKAMAGGISSQLDIVAVCDMVAVSE